MTHDDVKVKSSLLNYLFCSETSKPFLFDHHSPVTTISLNQTKPSLSSHFKVFIMDLDIMASIHSANHLSNLQYAPLHSDNYSVIRYTDVDDDGRYDFRCPFCDFEIQVPVFCGGFEEEYCSAPKDVVCPVCEENLGKDAITQFTHSSSQKWGWKSEKSSMWPGNSATFGKKLGARGNKQESIPDPLLSPFICNVPVLNSNSNDPDENSSHSNKDIDIDNAKRCMTDGGEQDQQERRLRATFVQKLILSTIFEEII